MASRAPIAEESARELLEAELDQVCAELELRDLGLLVRVAKGLEASAAGAVGATSFPSLNRDRKEESP